MWSEARTRTDAGRFRGLLCQVQLHIAQTPCRTRITETVWPSSSARANIRRNCASDQRMSAEAACRLPLMLPTQQVCPRRTTLTTRRTTTTGPGVPRCRLRLAPRAPPDSRGDVCAVTGL